MPDNNVGGRIFVNGEELSQKTIRAAGGGEKHHPQSFDQAQQSLAPQVAQIRETLAALPEHLRAERVVIEAEVFANYLANSYFPEDLVTQLKLRPLGSKVVEHGIQSLPSTGETDAVSKSFLLSADAEAVESMEAILSGNGGTKGAKDDLRQFTKIAVSSAHRATVAIPDDELEPFEAVLHPDPDDSTVWERAAASEATLAKFQALVESVGGRVHLEENDTVDGLTFVALELPPARVDEVAAFNPLRSLTPAPKVVLANIDESEEAESTLPLPTGVRGLPEVLVFDGGVDETGRVFDGHVTAVNLTGKSLVPEYARHGSAVTGAVLFGDVGNTRTLPEPAAHVTHYQILPGPDQDAAEFPWVLRQIRQVVDTTDARIVNLSLGPEAPVEDREPHRWTAVLDKIAYERQILFVTAAGNNGAADAATGLNRVQSPADMVNGLCVGASDKPAPEKDWDAAPYSGRGPGRPGARIQPAVLAFGGTPTRRFGRVRPNGDVVRDHEGTSYAAPLVTNALAKIAAQLDGRSDANTLRALAVHFAEKTDDHLLVDVGHGRLTSDVGDVLECAPSEATVIYQGVLKRDEVRAYPLPVPSTLNKGLVDIRWSLALSTATDSAEAGEYSKAGLELAFRPHADTYSMRRKKVGGSGDDTVHVHVSDEARVKRLVAEGWKLSKNPVTKQPKRSSRNEGARRDQGKWESLWRADTSMRATSLFEPRIDISHLTREGGRITTGTDDIEFSLVVTVSSRAKLPIYTDVQTEFSVLTALPVVTPITVNVGDVHTRV
ncbi:hypothetical protein ASF87_10330 [Microbacterium sp. Leaf161]|uniref:S8 family peptidase n=1 Tax=Microbacterium sp. Leaf161 TaxID=1736281 RepID=UPI0006F95992|nr:S8 family peptidase [Microbacterium sp. Leaf161]KQR49179.1 hypothetical protein ASF87_10330 [Microbacterium sp. Leaf161]